MTAADQTPATDSERDERTRRVQHAHFDGDGNDLGPCVLVSDLNGGPTDQWLSDGDADTEHVRVLAKGGAQDTGWLHAACSCGEYAWPCPHWLLAEHDRLTALIAEQAATIEEERAAFDVVFREQTGTITEQAATIKRVAAIADELGGTDADDVDPTALYESLATALGSQRTEGQG